jgi:hypothetical protein
MNEDSNVYGIGMGEGGKIDVYMLFISRERHFNETHRMKA